MFIPYNTVDRNLGLGYIERKIVGVFERIPSLF